MRPSLSYHKIKEVSVFKNIQDLSRFMEANEKLVLVSKPRKLRKIHILLLSLANGDFNPAHCQPGFSHVSIFKGLVSQGIGSVARAEGEFLQLMRFELPPEVIAIGIDNLHYFSPLRWGNIYTYTFEITNLRKSKRMWKCDCAITCTVKEGTDRVVAQWDWHIGFIKHEDHAAEEALMLQPKSYTRNVFENFVWRPLRPALVACALLATSCALWPHYLELGIMEAKLTAANLLYGSLFTM